MLVISATSNLPHCRDQTHAFICFEKVDIIHNLQQELTGSQNTSNGSPNNNTPFLGYALVRPRRTRSPDEVNWRQLSNTSGICSPLLSCQEPFFLRCSAHSFFCRKIALIVKMADECLLCRVCEATLEIHRAFFL